MSLIGSTNVDSRIDDDCLSTGVTVLDTEILNGIPKGSTIAILGDPTGMAELFNFHLVHTDRPTSYISTVRPARNIEQNLSKIGDLSSDVNIEDIFSANESTSDTIRKHSDRLKDGHNLIVDSLTSVYENGSEDFLQTVRYLYKNTANNNALSYVYFANNDPANMSRAEREALHMCDGIFLITTRRNGDDIDTRLEIRKLRGIDYPDELVKLNVGEKLTIDTTRDIA